VAKTQHPRELAVRQEDGPRRARPGKLARGANRKRATAQQASPRGRGGAPPCARLARAGAPPDGAGGGAHLHDLLRRGGVHADGRVEVRLGGARLEGDGKALRAARARVA
jgi:hypothetical protein